MSRFFRNFPVVNYKFGDEIDPALMQNITAYIDLVDQISDDATLYETYHIKNGERPDIVSYNLYSTVDYYWTFYLLNEKLRTQGWPLTQSEVYTKAQEYYPNTTLISTYSLHGEFYINDIVATKPFSNPGFKARILSKDLDLGQLVVKPIKEVRSITVNNAGSGYDQPPTVTFSGGDGKNATAQAVLDGDTVGSIVVLNGGDNYTVAPTITISNPELPRGTRATATAVLSTNSVSNNTLVYSQKNQQNTELWDDDNTDLRTLYVNRTAQQWRSVHHYEKADSDGVMQWVDLKPNVDGVGVQNVGDIALAGLTPVTHLDRLIKQNDELSKIKVFKPDVAAQVDNDFQKLLRDR